MTTPVTSSPNSTFGDISADHVYFYPSFANAGEVNLGKCPPAEMNGDPFLREKLAKTEIELKESKHLHIITELEKKALRAELNQQKLTAELNELKAKVAIMEQKGKETTEKNALAEHVKKLQNDQHKYLERITELEKKLQKQEEKYADRISSQQQQNDQQKLTTMEKNFTVFDNRILQLQNDQKKYLERISELEKKLQKQDEKWANADRISSQQQQNDQQKYLEQIGELEKNFPVFEIGDNEEEEKEDEEESNDEEEMEEFEENREEDEEEEMEESANRCQNRPHLAKLKGKLHFCAQCQKPFPFASNLKVHMRIHTGEKPYKCAFCDKRFVHSHNLQQHRRIHTGEKPFECDFCGKGFTQIGNLRSHLLRTHKTK